MALEHVTFRYKGKTREEEGRLVVTAQDGGIVLQSRDGVLWLIPPEDQIKRESDSVAFEPMTREELGKRMLAELPDGFQVLNVPHYLICYNTSKEYAKWCGSLFERLYGAFTNYWSRKGFELNEPEFPLVAVIFADKRDYQQHARPELGDVGDNIIGYYSLASNRMTMCDLTGVEAQGHRKLSTAAQINQILSQPDAARTVSTIVHEATHQIAFNCGLHTRLSDCPRWFSEGIAEYFETPDFRSAKGWGGIGNINDSRLDDFHRYLSTRPGNSIETLIRNDNRFSDAKEAIAAYAEAWALTYFLIKQHPKEYVAYLKLLSAKKLLVQDTPEQRINDFRSAFGELSEIETEFIRYMTRGK